MSLKSSMDLIVIALLYCWSLMKPCRSLSWWRECCWVGLLLCVVVVFWLLCVWEPSSYQWGAVKEEDQQKLLIIMTMLHLVAFAGMKICLQICLLLLSWQQPTWKANGVNLFGKLVVFQSEYSIIMGRLNPIFLAPPTSCNILRFKNGRRAPCPRPRRERPCTRRTRQLLEQCRHIMAPGLTSGLPHTAAGIGRKLPRDVVHAPLNWWIGTTAVSLVYLTGARTHRGHPRSQYIQSSSTRPIAGTSRSGRCVLLIDSAHFLWFIFLFLACRLIWEMPQDRLCALSLVSFLLPTWRLVREAECNVRSHPWWPTFYFHE